MKHGGAERGRLYIFNTAEKKVRELDSVPAELSSQYAAGTGGWNLAAAYDSINKKAIFMTADSNKKPQVWAYDVASDKWEKMPLGKDAPTLAGPFCPECRAPLMFDARNNLFFLITGSEKQAVQTWAYRYRNAAK